MTIALHLRSGRGFTLTELAVVIAIVGFLMATAMYTLSAQTEQRDFEETRRRLEAARELLLGFAMVNGRLPCPANATGDEAPLGGGACTVSPNHNGFLPARTLGFQIVDGNGFAIDPWRARIRYAVSSAALTGCTGTSTTPHFTNTANMKANGITCQPNDLVICRSATGITATTCGAAAGNALTNQITVVAVVYSVGRNNAVIGSGGIDEAANINGDRVFVSHPQAPVGATNGEFDDQMLWLTVGELYGKLIAAGALP